MIEIQKTVKKNTVFSFGAAKNTGNLGNVRRGRLPPFSTVLHFIAFIVNMLHNVGKKAAQRR